MPGLLPGQVVHLLVVQAAVADNKESLIVVILLRDGEPGLADGVADINIAGTGENQDQQGHRGASEQRELLHNEIIFMGCIENQNTGK